MTLLRSSSSAPALLLLLIAFGSGCCNARMYIVQEQGAAPSARMTDDDRSSILQDLTALFDMLIPGKGKWEHHNLHDPLASAALEADAVQGLEAVQDELLQQTASIMQQLQQQELEQEREQQRFTLPGSSKQQQQQPWGQRLRWKTFAQDLNNVAKSLLRGAYSSALEVQRSASAFDAVDDDDFAAAAALLQETLSGHGGQELKLLLLMDSGAAPDASLADEEQQQAAQALMQEVLRLESDDDPEGQHAFLVEVEADGADASTAAAQLEQSLDVPDEDEQELAIEDFHPLIISLGDFERQQQQEQQQVEAFHLRGGAQEVPSAREGSAGVGVREDPAEAQAAEAGHDIEDFTMPEDDDAFWKALVQMEGPAPTTASAAEVSASNPAAASFGADGRQQLPLLPLLLLLACAAAAALFVHSWVQLRRAMRRGAAAGHSVLPIMLERNGRMVQGLVLVPLLDDEDAEQPCAKAADGHYVPPALTYDGVLKASDFVVAGKAAK